MELKKITETELCEDNHSVVPLYMIRARIEIGDQEIISPWFAGKHSGSQKSYGCLQVPFTTGLRIATCTIIVYPCKCESAIHAPWILHLIAMYKCK